MKLYTKIINEETKECLIINQIEAEKQGLQNMEVEFGYDGKAYLKGYAPKKPQELINQEKITEYQKYLADTDYVVIKISEAIVSRNQQLIDELKNKYADVLNERDEARKKINELEEEIKNEQEKDIISIEEVDKLPENVNDDQVKVVDDVKITPDEIEKEQSETMETTNITP